jgi:hypothetical protein
MYLNLIDIGEISLKIYFINEIINTLEKDSILLLALNIEENKSKLKYT